MESAKNIGLKLVRPKLLCLYKIMAHLSIKELSQCAFKSEEHWTGPIYEIKTFSMNNYYCVTNNFCPLCDTASEDFKTNYQSYVHFEEMFLSNIIR